MATVATISVNFANYGTSSFTPQGVTDRSINPLTLAQYCLGSGTGDFSYIGGFVKKTGDTMSGMLTLPLTMPTSDNHATRKAYVDSRINSLSSTVSDTGAGGFVRISGSTMSGMLTLPVTDPTNVNHSTRKGYVDSRIQSLSGQVDNVLSGNPGYLRLNGGSMTGLINMGSYKITQLPTTGLNDTDAVPKKYVDDAIGGGTSGLISKTYVDTADGLRVLKAGDTMTGALNLPNSDPTLDNQAARKKYVDDRVATRTTPTDVSTAVGLRVLKAGDSMSGFLTLHANPNSDLHAATKQYVDAAVGGGTTGLVSKVYVDTADGLRVLKAGDTMTGFLTLHANPTSNLHAATKQYVDAAVINGTSSLVSKTYVDTADSARVLKSGDTMTGFLTLHANPTATTHASNKAYVDGLIATVTSAAASAQAAATAAAAAAAAANTNANNRVLKAGDTMTGDLTVQGKITATGDITAFSDIRLKNNITDIEHGLDKVLKLKGVTFDRITDGKKSIGVIAQDVLEVLPEVVNEEKDGYLSVAYGNIVGVLIEAIKELSNKVDNLEKQLNK